MTDPPDNTDIMEVTFQHAEDFESLFMSKNVLIATLCTSWAHIKLCYVMSISGTRVLYHYTNFIIFSVEYSIDYVSPLHEYLSNLTDELAQKWHEGMCKLWLYKLYL